MMSHSGSIEYQHDSSDEPSHSSLEQLCHVALHDRQHVRNHRDRVNKRTLANDSGNYVMLLSGGGAPKVVETEQSRAVPTNGGLFLNRMQNQCGNITFVNCVKAETVPGNIEGTIREINNSVPSEIYTDSFQTTDTLILNTEQKSPTFPQQYRKTRDFIPENLKDEGYWIKRKKNNEAAKRSREKRRNNDAALENRVAFLQQVNEKLTDENKQLKKSLAEAHDKIQFLENELQKMSSTPIIQQSPSYDIDRTKTKISGRSSQNPAVFYIQNPPARPSKYPSAVEQIEIDQEPTMRGNHAVGRIQTDPGSQFNQQISSHPFTIDQGTSSSILQHPTGSIIQQSVVHRSGQGTRQLAATGHSSNNSILVPIHQLSGLTGAPVATNQIGSVQQGKNGTSIVYLPTGCSVVPLNALVQTQSGKQDSRSGQQLNAHHSGDLSLHSQSHPNCLDNGASDLSDSAIDETCSTTTTARLIIQQQTPDGSVKTGRLVSMNTPIDHIIPLKKRMKDDSGSFSEDQSPGKMGQQPLSVSSDGHPVPGPGTPIAATPAPAITNSSTAATTSSTNNNNNNSSAIKLDQSTPDGSQESDSNSNPEYWRTQLITIMSEVERLKTQMGSITEQRTSQDHHMQPPPQQQQHSVSNQNNASSSGLENVATPPNQQPMSSSNFDIPQSSNQMQQQQQPAPQIVMVGQPQSVNRTPQLTNIETTPTKSPMMTANNSVNSINADLRTDSPLTTTTPNSIENQ